MSSSWYMWQCCLVGMQCLHALCGVSGLLIVLKIRGLGVFTCISGSGRAQKMWSLWPDPDQTQKPLLYAGMCPGWVSGTLLIE